MNNKGTPMPDDVFSKFMNALVNGWFKTWKVKQARQRFYDEDWQQCVDELETAISDYLDYPLCEVIAIALLNELERKVRAHERSQDSNTTKPHHQEKQSEDNQSRQ